MSKIDFENAKTLRKPMNVEITLGDVAFSDDNLISCTVALRGLKRTLDSGQFSIEGSEIEFKAVVSGDSEQWSKFVSEFDENQLITYSAGYVDEDMSPVRCFYLSDASFDSRTRVLTVKGNDATVPFLEAEYGGQFIESTYGAVAQDFYDGIKDILDDVGIVYTEAGTVPSGTESTATTIFFEKAKARELIANASGIFRNGNNLAITYRDAGRPQLIAGDSVVVWDIDESLVAELSSDNERNAKEYDVNLSSYIVGDDIEVAKVSDCVQGYSYMASISEPVYELTTSTNCTAELIGLYAIKINCTTSGECTVNGRQVVKQTLDGDAPRRIYDENQKGITVSLADMQLVDSSRGSLTALAIEDMLDEEAARYTFNYRGDPRIQPSDIIRIHRLTSEEALVPMLDLYPGATLYPSRDNTLVLRVESLTLTHEGGGLTSQIETRVATLYEAPGMLYPGITLYPSNTTYPA